MADFVKLKIYLECKGHTSYPAVAYYNVDHIVGVEPEFCRGGPPPCYLELVTGRRVRLVGTEEETLALIEQARVDLSPMPPRQKPTS